MRFEVPQFIEIEDKIVGPFTWKQFVYIAGGTGAVLVLYFTVPFIIFILLGLPIAGLAGFLAFHKINNRPFAVFLESMVSYFMGNKLYLWQKRDPQTISAKAPATPLEIFPSTASSVESPAVASGGISSLAHKLEMAALEDPNQTST